MNSIEQHGSLISRIKTSLIIGLVVFLYVSCSNDTSGESTQEANQPVSTSKSDEVNHDNSTIDEQTESDQGELLSTDVKIDYSKEPFTAIKTHGIPSYDTIMKVLSESGIAVISKKNGLDQLEIDLLFLKTSEYPFTEYRQQMLKDGTERKFGDIFPDDKLIIFYRKARAHLTLLNGK